MAPTHIDADLERVMGIQDYALIGNMRTAALVSITGSIDSMCMPYFDSPSIFAKVLDNKKGGHFSISPVEQHQTKQAYSPSSNILATKFLNEVGVGQVTDFLVPKASCKGGKPFLPWLVRRVQVIRGKVKFRMECAPAFDYARAEHTMEVDQDDSQVAYKEYDKKKVVFRSKSLSLDLRMVVSGENLCGQNDPGAAEEDDPFRKKNSNPKDPNEHEQEVQEGSNIDVGRNELRGKGGPDVQWTELDLSEQGHKGMGVYSEFEVCEGEIVDFILREIPDKDAVLDKDQKSNGNIATRTKAEELGVDLTTLAKGVSKIRADQDPVLSAKLVDSLHKQTSDYWISWISKATYKGRWRESVLRQALTLKMMVFEETGAIIAAPTFSLPEHIGGGRNWDYRYTWIRDSSFTLYALIRLGYTDEANKFMEFIQARLFERNSNGSLQIMYTIHGGKEMPEVELDHLDGHKGSKPVRIGNGASDHVQLDIYGELMDAVYLAQKSSKPLSWDMWISVREMVDYACTQWQATDLSIWEVRGEQKNFLYSKIMLWVCVDRGLRLAEKRSLPCPNRARWLEVRDNLYEEIMTKGWNEKEKFFAQSYESLDVVDSAVLVMPLVFFMSAADPRFRSTLDRILQTPEKGGLCANNLIFRYDTEKVNDGVGGSEGAFSLCTLWGVEALARAGAFEPALLPRATAMLEDFLGYGNHVGLFSEEISRGGEGLGNTPQAFSAVTVISTCFNLDRTLNSSH